MAKNFLGTVIEESLEKKEVLKKIKILKTRIEKVVEKHKTPWLIPADINNRTNRCPRHIQRTQLISSNNCVLWYKQWTLHAVEISESQAESVAKEISRSLDSQRDCWYADFKNDSYHYIIFYNKIFFIDRQSKEQYDEAKHYGISLSIPHYQVDFHPNVKEWGKVDGGVIMAAKNCIEDFE